MANIYIISAGFFIGILIAFIIVVRAQKERFKKMESMMIDNMKTLLKEMDKLKEDKNNKGENKNG